jgi:hypothetical protein
MHSAPSYRVTEEKSTVHWNGKFILRLRRSEHKALTHSLTHSHSLVSVLRATSVTLARNKGTAPWRSGAVVMETKLYTKQESHVGGRGVNVSVRSNIREKKE